MAKPGIDPSDRSGGTPAPRVAQVLLPRALDAPFSYLIPQGMTLQDGSYVVAPLGGREVTGVVWALTRDAPPDKKLKPVLRRLDLPAMPAIHRRVIVWLAQYYLQPLGMVLRLSLSHAAVCEPRRGAAVYRPGSIEPDRLTAHRRRVLAAAAQGPARTAQELAAISQTSVSVVRGLARAGALKASHLPAHEPLAVPRPGPGPTVLSPPQEDAAKRLRLVMETDEAQTVLLDGVTGSGKTEVYFEAMAQALAAGRQVLLLLPEIALTAQFLERIEERFRAAPAAWHSALRPNLRAHVWQAVARGEAQIVVGARSALFLPWRRLGLIIVDEEHEAAYKQQEGVNYHARDMAVVYGKLGRFPVVLCSATPSLESLANVDRGRYQAIRLTSRHGRAVMPAIEIADLRLHPPEPGRWLSPPLANAVNETLDRGEQALLFLNRRGFAPLTLCRSCGHRVACPHCAAWLVEHRFMGRFMCHHCGHSEAVYAVCRQCGAEDAMTACGPGVERLAEEAAQRFPEARLAVLSSDLTRGADMRQMFRDIAAGDYDLIIGTQMVAKGHHFPLMTLAGIVDADLALEAIDPRAGERSWQLLAQVAGRTGRGEKPGRAIVQTYMSAHPVMRAFASGDRQAYYAHEKSIRQAARLPPYGLLAAVIISGRNREKTLRFADALARRIPVADGIDVFGPAPAPLAVIRTRHRFRFLVKAGRSIAMQAFLQSWLGDAKSRGGVSLTVDIDPYTFL